MNEGSEPVAPRATRTSLGERKVKRVIVEGDADLTGCTTAAEILKREWGTVPLSDSTLFFQVDDGRYVTVSLEMRLRTVTRREIVDDYGIDIDEGERRLA